MADLQVQEELLQRCRAYLTLLARSQFGARMQAKLDASDIVQQVLLRAQEKKDQFRGTTPAELMAWLRQILANEIAATARKFNTGARDLDRERSIQSDLDRSSSHMQAWLASDQSSPSHCASREEDLLRLADALAQLPAEQRLCVELHHLKGCKVAEVAEQLGRSEEAVVGLLYRGVKKLRQLMEAKP